jgi:hypothetical protein
MGYDFGDVIHLFHPISEKARLYSCIWQTLFFLFFTLRRRFGLKKNQILNIKINEIFTETTKISK